MPLEYMFCCALSQVTSFVTRREEKVIERTLSMDHHNYAYQIAPLFLNRPTRGYLNLGLFKNMPFFHPLHPIVNATFNRKNLK